MCCMYPSYCAMMPTCLLLLVQMRAKLYRFGPKEGTNKDDSKQKAGNEWFDVGVGPLRVLVPKEGSGNKCSTLSFTCTTTFGAHALPLLRKFLMLLFCFS